MTCSICLEELESNVRTLECLHSFHIPCLENWKQRQRTCPVCREPFDTIKYKVSISVEPLEYINTFEISDLSVFYRIFSLDFETQEELLEFLTEFEPV